MFARSRVCVCVHADIRANVTVIFITLLCMYVNCNMAPHVCVVKNRRDSSKNKNKFITVQKTNNQRYVVETITMTTTTVSERRIVREATEDLAANATGPAATTTSSTIATVTASASVLGSATTAFSAGGGESDLMPPALPAKPGATSISSDLSDAERPPPIPPKENSPTTQISGILKGGKLWKQDSISQVITE